MGMDFLDDLNGTKYPRIPLRAAPAAAPMAGPADDALSAILADIKNQGETPEQRDAVRKQKLISGLSEVFEQAATAGSRARSGEKFDNSFYQAQRQGIDTDRQQDLQQKQEMLRSKILGKQLVDSDSDRKRQIASADENRQFALEDRATAKDDRDRKLKQEAEDRDPTSRRATIMRGAMQQLAPGLQLEGFGVGELNHLVPMAKAIRDAKTEDQKVAAQWSMANATKELHKLESKNKNEREQNEASLKMNKEYREHPVTRQTDVVADSYNKIEALAEQAGKLRTGAGDRAVIYQVMKLMDPTTGVKEGEIATAEKSGGLDSRVVNAFNATFKGQVLSPEQRQDFVATARTILEKQLETQQKVYDAFSDTATRHSYNPLKAFGEKPKVPEDPRKQRERELDERNTNSAFDQLKQQGGQQEASPGAFSLDDVKAFAARENISEVQARQLLERRMRERGMKK